MYQPKIATHWTPEEAETTRQMILAEAKTLSEDEIAAKVQELMNEGDKWNSKMIHDPALQDTYDRMLGRWVSDCSEMAAMWCMAEGAA